jgi:hemoglobin
MASRKGGRAVALILIALGTSAIASAQPPIAPAGSLYARLGGTSVVTAFVADTIDKLVANPETNHSFDRVNLQQVKDLLTARICTLTGGGCADSGARLREVHAGQLVTESSGLVEALRESMRARDVPLAARNQLLEILAPMNRDVDALTL